MLARNVSYKEFTPYFGQVLVKRLISEEDLTTPSGIIHTTNTAKIVSTESVFLVVSAGDDCKQAKAGDNVMLNNHPALKLQFEEGAFWLCYETNILGKVAVPLNTSAKDYVHADLGAHYLASDIQEPAITDDSNNGI